MGEIGLEHIEPDFAFFRPVTTRGNELEFGFGIDEAPQQPSARHPVDVYSPPGNPNAPAILAGSLICVAFRRTLGIQLRLETADQPLGALSSQRIKEINCHHFLQPFSEAPHIGFQLRAELEFQLASGGGEATLQSARPFRDCRVIGVASRPEESLDIRIGEAIDETCLTNRALPPSFFDLAENPLKVL